MAWFVFPNFLRIKLSYCFQVMIQLISRTISGWSSTKANDFDWTEIKSQFQHPENLVYGQSYCAAAKSIPFFIVILKTKFSVERNSIWAKLIEVSKRSLEFDSRGEDWEGGLHPEEMEEMDLRLKDVEKKLRWRVLELKFK